ncbi:ArsR/SmtB family transcription factor [Hyalangium rubrum]|uniref:ArsR/SmtB family transcription factor n=1 Tax=Hyalangium rubrum TaxID=3103134 RepID=UPI003BF5BDE7
MAEPNRRFLLELLAEGGRSAGELVEALPSLTQPAVSRHLRVLREVGLVEVRPEAQRRIYTLCPERLVELDQWLSRYRRFWSDRLDALEQHLNTTHGTPRPNGKTR